MRGCVVCPRRPADGRAARVPSAGASGASSQKLATEGDAATWMHDSGAGDHHITPYITDIDSWTSNEVTSLGGIGGGAIMSCGSGTVNMLAIDSNGRPYNCYTMHNVKYAPSAGVRLYATEPERVAGVELRTSTMTHKCGQTVLALHTIRSAVLALLDGWCRHSSRS